MPKPRITQRVKTGRKWGTNKVSETTRRRPDGSTYIEWRMPYYVDIPVLDEQSEIVTFERKRRFACSTVGPEDAEAKADLRRVEAGEVEEAYWREQKALRGELVIPGRVDEVRTPERKTLTEVAHELNQHNKRYVQGKVEGHRKSYRKKLDNYINHVSNASFAGRPMDTLRPAEIHAWFHDFMAGHSQSTSARFKKWLLRVGDWAKESDYWSTNLFTRLPSISMEPGVESQRVFTFREIDQMWLAANSPQLRALLVMLRCGLRQGECLALREDDILDEQTIQVKYTLTEEDNLWDDVSPSGKVTKAVQFLGPPKTARSAAKIHIPKPWMKLVEESLRCSDYKQVRAFDDAMVSAGKARLHRFVIGNRFGLLWDEWSASRGLKKLMERAGVLVNPNESTFHAWRHTFCSDLVALGANDIELGALMRHSDPNLSKKVYAQARHEHLQRYKRYSERIDKLTDYVEMIREMDEDRREGKW